MSKKWLPSLFAVGMQCNHHSDALLHVLGWVGEGVNRLTDETLQHQDSLMILFIQPMSSC